MIQAVPFFRFDGAQRTPLFRVLLEGSDFYVTGTAFADAILVMSRPIEIGERTIGRHEKPMEFFQGLPMAYSRDPLTAGEPVKCEGPLLKELRSEPVLIAWKDALEYVAFEAGRLVDAKGEPVKLDFVRRISEGTEEGWTSAVPLPLVLRLLGSSLPMPIPEEVSREFFAEIRRFRHEYENWKNLYKRPENWTKVMVGNLSHEHIRDCGLWEKIGRRFFPGVEPRKFGFSQGWMAPAGEPGAPDRTAVVMGELDRFGMFRSAIADFNQIDAGLFVICTYERSTKYPEAFEAFRDFLTRLPERRRPKAPVLVIVGPLPSELFAPWAEFRWEPDTGKFNRTIWEL